MRKVIDLGSKRFYELIWSRKCTIDCFHKPEKEGWRESDQLPVTGLNGTDE